MYLKSIQNLEHTGMSQSPRFPHSILGQRQTRFIHIYIERKDTALGTVILNMGGSTRLAPSYPILF